MPRIHDAVKDIIEYEEHLQTLREQLHPESFYNYIGEEIEILAEKEAIAYISGDVKTRRKFQRFKPIAEHFKNNATLLDINIPTKLSDIKIDKKIEFYSKRQLAILFDQLRKSELILNHNDTSLSKILFLLTGIEAEQMRTKGLSFAKSAIPKTSLKDEINNGEIVIMELQKIIQRIQKDVDSKKH